MNWRWGRPAGLSSGLLAFSPAGLLPWRCPDSEQFPLKLITLAADYHGHGFLLMPDE